MKKTLFPLFWKFVIAVVVIVGVFGSVNIIVIQKSVYQALENELDKRGMYIAKNISERSVSPILYDEIPALHDLLDDAKKIDESIAYIFILNSRREVITHTFDKSVPQEIVDANSIASGEKENTLLIYLENEDNKVIRDIAIPILGGKIGVVRVGIEEENIIANIDETTNTMVFMILIFLLIGVFGAFFFSYVIVSPIKVINKVADKIDINSLGPDSETSLNIEKSIFYRIWHIWKIFHTNDELDILVNKFNDMINRLKSTYGELENTQKSLLHTEKLASIGTLTAGIAHEIQNPVAGLENCIRRISENPDNKEQNKKYLLLMSEAIDKIEKVLQGLLNFSRKQEFSFEKVNISTLIGNAMLLAAFKLEKSKISIIKEYTQDLPLVKASPNHLEQVFLNLFINGIDAIVAKQKSDSEHKGFIKISIVSDENNLLCTFTDNGIGIDAKLINYVFDPFYTTKDIGEGTGLGLSICYNILKDHNGNIKVESEKGKETKFTISLPKINK